MTKPEFTNNRDLRYSHWHREALPGWCYATDLDWIEWRSDKGIVAFLETKMNGRLSPFQQKVYAELERITGIPAFYVSYDKQLTVFTVTRISDGSSVGIFNEEEYVAWITGLGQDWRCPSDDPR